MIDIATKLQSRDGHAITVLVPVNSGAMAKPAQTPATDRATVIYNALWHAIIEQALQPGAKLPEDAIGEKFGASRTIVRAALGRLAAEGLVELRRNRGAAVATPSWNEARDVFDVRIGLERLVVARLAGGLSRDQIKALKAHVDAEEQAHGSNMPLQIRLATAFHIKLAEMTGNPVLARYVSEVASRCGLILALYNRPHSPECAVNEHREIITALASGDVARATRLMDHHLDAVADRALISAHPAKERDIQDILAPYAAEAAPAKAKKRR